jgi:hypothetical protein
MLVLADLDADISRGCAGLRIGHLLFATHPRPGIRELTLSDTLQFSRHFGLGQDRRDESLGTPLPNTFASRKLLLYLLPF